MSVEIAVTLHARDQQSDAPASVATIAPVIGRWAGSVNPDAIIESGEWIDVGRTKDRLLTEKLDLGADADWAWVFRRYHRDDDDPTVTWIVEIEVAEQADKPDTEIAIILMRESSDGRVRPLRTDPPEPPRVIRDLLDAPDLEYFDGSIALWSDPRTLRREYAAELVEALGDPRRRLPVIGVSINPETDAPIVDVPRLARRVAGMAHVWLVPPDATWALSEQLPPKLGVFNGAIRIWWPGFGPDADPFEHHLFMRNKWRPEEQIVALVRGASTDRFSRPGGISKARDELRAREEALLLDDLAAMASGGSVDESLLDELRGRIHRLQEDRDAALKLAEEEERLRRAAEQVSAGLAVALREAQAAAAAGNDDAPDMAVDPDEAFVDEVRSAYRRKVCPSQGDRRRFPLKQVHLHPDFLQSVYALEGIGRDKILEVCAQVACGRAPEISGRKVHRMRISESGNAEYRRRGRDGAQAWRCALQISTPSARRLHWWVVPGGAGRDDVIELAHVGKHDDLTFPE